MGLKPPTSIQYPNCVISEQYLEESSHQKSWLVPLVVMSLWVILWGELSPHEALDGPPSGWWIPMICQVPQLYMPIAS